jgi:hypothetical protein
MLQVFLKICHFILRPILCSYNFRLGQLTESKPFLVLQECTNMTILGTISGSYGGEYEDDCALEFWAV